MEFKEGQRLRIKEFDEIPRHWNPHGKMCKWMGKIVTFEKYKYDNKIEIYEDSNEQYGYGWSWKQSDFQIVFDTWEDVVKEIKKECYKYTECKHCPIDDGFYCYDDYFEDENYKKLSEQFKKMFGMECYVLEDEKMKKEFKLSDLKDEMVLVTRDKYRYVVIDDNFIGKDAFDNRCNYGDDMKNIHGFDNLDIIEVYNPSRKYDNGLYGLLELVGEPIWKETEEPVTKDVSLEEINVLLKEKYPDVEKFNLLIDNDK